MNYDDLKFNYNLLSDGDAWGDAMHWWFVIADEIYFNRQNLQVPESWEFRPSPLGETNDGDDFAVSAVRDADDESLMKFGVLMNRYASMLRAAGRDY